MKFLFEFEVLQGKALKVPSIDIPKPLAGEMASDNEFKILGAILSTLAIFVVNALPLLQRASQHPLHDQTVLPNIFLALRIIFMDVAVSISKNS